MEFYKVKITRKGTKPPIWRRCLVPADITFSQMAVVLEEILEYETSSLYEFEFFPEKSTHPGMDRRRGKRNLAV